MLGGGKLKFHVEINTIEEFAVFCALLRGEVLPEGKLRELAAMLQKATKNLQAAEDADAHPRR
jgi:hypothetical protein